MTMLAFSKIWSSQQICEDKIPNALTIKIAASINQTLILIYFFVLLFFLSIVFFFVHLRFSECNRIIWVNCFSIHISFKCGSSHPRPFMGHCWLLLEKGENPYLLTTHILVKLRQQIFLLLGEGGKPRGQEHLNILSYISTL